MIFSTIDEMFLVDNFVLPVVFIEKIYKPKISAAYCMLCVIH